MTTGWGQIRVGGPSRNSPWVGPDQNTPVGPHQVDKASCTWRVPRYLARRHVLAIFNLPIKRSGGVESGAELQADMKLGDEEESLRECPKCSSVHFSQHPVRS